MAAASKILVVEDNDFVRMQIVNYLKDGGYAPLEASEGEAALNILTGEEGHEVGMAVVDIRMDPVGGLEFVRMIRGREMTVPVIFVTGDQTADLLEQAAKLGVPTVLMKPVMKDRLLTAVERTLGSRAPGKS